MKKLTITVALLAGFISYSGYSQCCGAKTRPEQKAITSETNKTETSKICQKCGEIKGTEKCCNPQAEKCKKCGLNKGSAGCCKLKQQSTCPVTGEELTDKKYFIDIQGKRIYACCPGCIEKIKTNPEKYIKQLQEKGIKIENAKQ